jgi:hypothetical protein
MQQTLLALLALIITVLLSYNQERSMMHARTAMIDAEMEVMASGVALQVLEFIGHSAFDEQTTNDAKVTLTSELTGGGSFGSSGRCDVSAPIETTYPYALCDDIDDFHEMVMESVPFILQSDTVFFDVTAKVQYVDADGKVATGATFNKKVVVTVEHAGLKQYLKSPVVLSRTFSYERLQRS